VIPWCVHPKFGKDIGIFYALASCISCRIVCKRYLLAQQQRTSERVAFVRNAMRRCKKWTYPNNLVELPPFELWFASDVVEDLTIGEEVAEDVISISSSPSNLLTCYWSMYAFGNHLRVAIT